MHSLYVGVTLSGKTTLARYISRQLRANGQTVGVFDPMGTPTRGGGWGDGAHVFNDESQFLAWVGDDRVMRSHLFIDEADLVVNHARPENLWLLTRGRHYGFSVNLITQRPAMLHPTARGQATRLYMFRLARKDRQLLGQEKGFDDFDAIDLDAGEFIVANSAQREITRLNLDQLLKE